MMIFEKILIVDDSVTSRMIIKRCFQIAGFTDTQYFEADDGLQAMSFLADNRVDLVLSDLRMPKMDGKTFIKKLNICQKSNRTPVIVISSMGNDISEKQLYDTGVKAIIRKPISPQKVVDVLGDNQ